MRTLPDWTRRGFLKTVNAATLSALTASYPRQTPTRPFKKGEPVEVVIDSLQANTRYFYQFRACGIQGAESTLAFLLSLAEMRQAQNMVTSFKEPITIDA